MTKYQFLSILKNRLSGLTQDDIEERLRFYSEMIDDRMEEGLSEDDAVSAVGSVDEILAQMQAELPPAKGRDMPQRRLNGWLILLLVLGCPVWLSLLISAVAVVFSLYISLWAVVVSFWAVFTAVAGCALGGIVGGIGYICGGHGLTGIAMIGAGMVCTGLAILLFFGCKAATKGTVLFAEKAFLWMKNRCSKKEEAR